MKKGIEDDFLLKSQNSFGEERFAQALRKLHSFKGSSKSNSSASLVSSSVLHSRDGAASKGREQRSNVFCPFSTLAETKQFSCVSPSPVFQRLRPSNRAPPILRPSLRRVKEREREREKSCKSMDPRRTILRFLFVPLTCPTPFQITRSNSLRLLYYFRDKSKRRDVYIKSCTIDRRKFHTKI